MIFSENFHIGTMICNFGYLDNVANLESIVNLFNMNIVELVETQIKDRIIYFNMISNKDLSFEKFLSKKPVKNNSDVISSTVKNILNAKLQKFKNNNLNESNQKNQSQKTSNKNLTKSQDKSNNLLSIPNVNFDKKAVFKKSFKNFLRMAEELKDGEIMYKI